MGPRRARPGGRCTRTRWTGLARALPAAGIYALAAVLLWGFDRRALWIVGAVLQVLVIAMYVMVSPQRDPAFEVWGITIRVLQVGLLAALTYLAVRSGDHSRAERP